MFLPASLNKHLVPIVKPLCSKCRFIKLIGFYLSIFFVNYSLNGCPQSVQPFIAIWETIIEIESSEKSLLQRINLLENISAISIVFYCLKIQSNKYRHHFFNAKNCTDRKYHVF